MKQLKYDNKKFPKLLTNVKKKFGIVLEFLGYNEVENYWEMVENILKNLKIVDCRISLKKLKTMWVRTEKNKEENAFIERLWTL